MLFWKYVETHYTDLCLHISLDAGLICIMRRLGPFIAALFLWGEATCQDPMRRMDPDDWFGLEMVQEGWRIIESVDSAFALRVSFKSGSFRKAAGTSGEWYSREDDMRMVIDSTGSSVGRSHNHGFNLGSYHFSWRNRYYALGGGGFWNNHSKLVEFVPSTGEWEFQPCPNAPVYVNNSASWLDVSQGRIVAMEIDNLGVIPDGCGTCRPVHSLDLANLSWNRLGMTNPLLEVMFAGRKSRAVDLGEYFLFFSLHKAVIIRKMDLMAVMTDAFNLDIFTRSLASVDRSQGYLTQFSRGGHFFIQFTDDFGAPVTSVLDWDVAEAFRKGVEEAFPFVVPMMEDVVESSDSVETLDKLWVPPLMLLLILVAFTMGHWLSGRSKNLKLGATSAGVQGNLSERARSAMSPMATAFLNCGKETLDTSEFNAFIGLDEDSSEESKRSRRAQIIRQVNQEYQLLHGQELITRQKDPIDRRRTTYIIRPYSNNA